MRILVVTQGPYGERIARNVRDNAPGGWTVAEVALPKALPPLIDEPDDFLPQSIPEADLLIAAGESSGAAQLTTDIATRSKARAAIAPIDNSAWLPQGLANQIKRELAGAGTAAVFPKLRIQVNPDTRLIDRVDVERDSACGSVAHTATRMIGLSADKADTKSGLILHHYPCLCSMTQEQIDDRLYDTLMHVSGYIMNEEVAEQVKPFKTPPRYHTPDGYAGRD